ncbi:coiled-coil domain-containing protein R3HCC1L isoform X2 [Anopheles moucheti]|uniref:coiled-coil domain-containing protein R3HCC1L isoform X2 n=1 Tax=Anopheles moucheti TaxID=186751 RepID=UPI0022F09973|nr:coiled-coil domain-containing protein R3HCC1L isoform X2 [Anopheles moucheti]
MGTDTILQGGGGTAVHQQQRQPHGTTSTTTHQRSPYLIDEDAAYGDAMKDSSPHTDSVEHSHHQQEQSPFVNGVKFPPVVGIYRPPAARRALNLAENIVHQLAPPAACEHPNDYGHLTLSAQHSPATDHQQVHLLLHTAAGDGSEPDKILTAPDSREGHPLRKDKPGTCEKTSHAGQETLQSLSRASVPECTGQIGSNDSTGNSCSRNSIGVAPPSARINRPARERRPDRAVYVPRARRSLTTPPVATAQSQSSPPEATEGNVAKVSTSPTKGLLDTASNRVQLPEPEQAAISLTSSVSSKEVVKLKDGKRKLSELPSAGELQSGITDTLACDTVIEAPLRTLATDGGDGEVSLESLKKRGHSFEEQQELQRIAVELVEAKGDRESLAISPFYRNKHKEESLERNCGNINTRPEEEVSKENSDCTPKPVATTMHRNNQRNRNARNTTCNTTQAPLATGMLITDSNETEKIDRDEKELRRASQEINRSNRRIMKQTFNSDVLEIGQKKKVAAATEAVSNGKTSKSEVATTADDGEEEADDWESMYDDNGDCLNPKMLEELTTAVGKVSIEAPQSDYKLFETKQAVLNEEEFPHVLEVSNFPAEFKTQDLMMLFSQYKETGFDIKWVDDTHALAVFSSSKIAAEVLTAGLSFARVKPLAEATAESRSKARKCSSSLQPYRARPETCAAMARRMVTSALGVKLKTAPEERENERRLLREAKERKRLAAKQRDEVWDS